MTLSNKQIQKLLEYVKERAVPQKFPKLESRPHIEEFTLHPDPIYIVLELLLEDYIIRKQEKNIPILPKNVSRQEFLEVEQEVMNILKTTKKVTI